MNSFTFIRRGIDAAIREQIAAYERGEQLEQSTYDYDPDTDRLTVHRSKEEADDYRYFPEPDLVPIEPPAELVERLRGEIRELPAARIRRLETALDFEHAYELVASGRDALYERLLDSTEPRVVANAVMNEIAAANLDPAAVNAVELAKVIAVKGELPRDVYTNAISESGDPGFSADRFLTERTTSDESALEPAVDAVIVANPEQVATYRGGKEGVLGFLVGQVLKETQGKADPKVVNRLLREKLRV